MAKNTSESPEKLFKGKDVQDPAMRVSDSGNPGWRQILMCLFVSESSTSISDPLKINNDQKKIFKSN